MHTSISSLSSAGTAIAMPRGSIPCFRTSDSPRAAGILVRHLRGPCLALAVLLSVMHASGQPANVRISPPGTDPEEVTIAINPANPDNMVAGANLRYFFWSTDAGRTWTTGEQPPGTWGDPCVIFDKGGRAYMANLTYGWDAITVRTSDDGGQTWSAGVKLYGPSTPMARPGGLYQSSLQDKEWLVADMSGGPYDGTIYASWTDFTLYGSSEPKDSSVIVFSRSMDRGATWEPFVRVSDKAGDAVDSDNTMEGAVPATGPDGEVYVAWAGPEGLYFDRSFDGGRTFGTDRIIEQQPGGWDIEIAGISRCNGLPVTLADVSQSPFRGTIYVNWLDSRLGDNDVWVMRSTDRGDTWSTPVRVNDDARANGREQFFTWATVDPVTGDVVVVFYDRRGYATDSTDVYLARSTDGGRSFVNERISSSAFLPRAMTFFGDYNGIAAWNGRIRPIWTRLNEDALSIHTALIDVSTGIDDPAAPGGAQILGLFPHPVSAATSYTSTIRYALGGHSRVRLEVHDVIGRTVAVLVDGEQRGGEHDVQFDASLLHAGVYICRLAATRDGGRSAASSVVLTVVK
jgi:hypothetical protein